MGDTTLNTEPPVDGRRARRERGRSAVIDAVFELAEEGKIPPTAELVAERSGVSVASIFRYFDGLDDLQLQTYRRFRERFAPLLGAVGAGSRADRIAALVESRLDLYEQAGPMMAIGRLRALEHAPLLEASTETKAALADQVRAALEPDTRDSSPGRVAELVAVIDAFTSVEAWDVMRRTHARSRRQIASSWCRGIDALIDDWEQDGN
jgi:TetR/AcrR family transcriptional regulator of autoinduction and epiphytic fitness